MICPNCNTLKTEFFTETKNTHGSYELSEEKFIILKCSSCGLIFPRIKREKEYFKKYYPNNYYHLRNSLLGWLETIYGRLVILYSKLSILRIKKEGKILDFGCGWGEFLKSLPETFEKYGVEINPHAIKHLKENHSQIHVFPTLNGLEKKNIKFDLITLFHTIEHIFNPKETLSKLTSLLKEDGMIILSTPNSNSLGFKIGSSRWFHLDTPRHLAIFNVNNLFALLKENGLEVISLKGAFMEYPLDFFWSIYGRFKNKNIFWNILLGIIISPVNLIVKLTYLFIPNRSETITVICKKTRFSSRRIPS